VAVNNASNVISALDDAPLGRFHLRAVLVSGMGFFTDAYDLFVIGIASTLVKQDWHLSSGRLGLLNSATLGAAFLGALVFGRVADLAGRKRVYWLVAVIMVAGAIGSALAASFWMLIGFRFLLGIGIGGDYPVSAVLMSEFANRRDRGKLVGMVFSTQALGLIVGPLVALSLLGAGTGADIAWRTMLALGAVPAAAVIYLRRKMPESPRYLAQVRGRAADAATQLAAFGGGQARGGPENVTRQGMTLRAFLTKRRYLLLLAGTAGTWFLLDYAYYGNTISTPQILKLVAPHASSTAAIAIQLAIFVVAALPGYALAISRMDRIGHRRLQLIGFAVMALCFGVIALVPGMTTAVAPFLVFFGISYFFTEFGPNTTTFVLPGEVFPVSMRATGHGISASIGKFGAFVGVFLFPVLKDSLGLRGTLALTAGVSIAGMLLTRLLPEPSNRSLDEVAGDDKAAPAPALADT
jgi:MFS transporter, PHS family, inorganic phosphate transporter